MKDKKYLPSVLIMYLNYFIHGVGCSVLGQAGDVTQCQSQKFRLH